MSGDSDCAAASFDEVGKANCAAEEQTTFDFPELATLASIDGSQAAGSAIDLEGPSSLEATLHWASDYCSSLRSQTPDAFKRVLHALSRRAGGVYVWSDYSGMGGAELAVAHICQAVQQACGGESGESPQALVYRARDNKQHCRDVLLAHSGIAAPKHVFGDVMETVPVSHFFLPVILDRMIGGHLLPFAITCSMMSLRLGRRHLGRHLKGSFFQRCMACSRRQCMLGQSDTSWACCDALRLGPVGSSLLLWSMFGSGCTLEVFQEHQWAASLTGAIAWATRRRP